MFETEIQKFVFYDKYSRWNDKLGRRETWDETVNRVVGFLEELSEYKLDPMDYDRIYEMIYDGTVSPSMRLMATAGKAARRNHLLLYNCAYLPIVSIPAFAEIMWLSMSGIGVGYSVENQYVAQLPIVQERLPDYNLNHVIEDSAEGWVTAYAMAVHVWFNGGDIEFDYSMIRPAGAPLKTKGGTASGPGVLIDLMDRTRSIIFSRRGAKLRPIDVFDIVTTIGNCAVSGGVRRSAQLTMFDHTDNEMLRAKQGEFWHEHPYRSNANISAVWNKPVTRGQVTDQLNTMFSNMTGEPGIVSRYAMNKTKPNRRRALIHGGLNPCAEINLHGATADGRFGGQLCNLSSVNLRPDMTLEEIEEAAEVASIIGTIQSMATDFRLLRPTWKEICEEERLIGVSLVGFSDSKIARKEANMRCIRMKVAHTNQVYAEILGINPSPATTCVKPAGNSSVMYGVSRGMNPRFADYYIRRVRVGADTPVYKVLDLANVPMQPENGQEEWPEPSVFVASFYEKSPDDAITVDDTTAVSQLDMWLRIKQNWTEHNPSVTIEYRPEEEKKIIDWVYANQDYLNGISFLPRNDVIYQQPPYEKISEAEFYNAHQPAVNWQNLGIFESSDNTSFELECAGGVCDLR